MINKQKINLKAHIVVVLLFAIIFGNFNVKADNSTIQTVSSNKQWKITFNKEVNLDEQTKNSIVVSDSNGVAVNVTKTKGTDNKTIIVAPPTNGYTVGQQYTLTVGSNLTAADGKKIKSSHSVKFLISSNNNNGNNGGPGGFNVDTSYINTKYTDVAYETTSNPQKLDIYLPNEGKGPFPVIVSIHGGGFAMGGKVGPELQYALEGLKRGYAVVSVDYRLSGTAQFPAQIKDIKAAIRFIKANASEYNLDSTKIATWGSSAGANLAALSGTSAGVADLEDLTLGNSSQSSDVQAVIDWYGPINFLTMDDEFKASGIAGQVHNTADSFESKYMGALITSIPDQVQKSNPTTYITKNDPAFFIQHGDADANVPCQQSKDFAAKLSEVLGSDKVTFEIIQGAKHLDDKFTTAANMTKVFDFLDKALSHSYISSSNLIDIVSPTGPGGLPTGGPGNVPGGTTGTNGNGGMGSSTADTSSVKTKFTKTADLTYVNTINPSSAQKLDIYVPEGTGPFPVIVSIHGGAFKGGDKNSGELNPMLAGLDKGYAVVSVGYRLSGEAKFPAQIYDIKAAIRYIKANAGKYNLNPNKIATWGGSAGGNLSALAGTSGGVTEIEDLTMGNADQTSTVEAVVDWFGPIYFSTMDAEFAALGATPITGATNSSTSPETAYLGKTIGTTEAEELVKKASPQTYITAEDPAFFIQHGTADRNIPITQSENFAAALIKLLGSDKVTFEKIEGAGHGTSEFSTTENVTKVLNFLDKYLK